MRRAVVRSMWCWCGAWTAGADPWRTCWQPSMKPEDLEESVDSGPSNPRNLGLPAPGIGPPANPVRFGYH